jgi:hypothetical protein
MQHPSKVKKQENVSRREPLAYPVSVISSLLLLADARNAPKAAKKLIMLPMTDEQISAIYLLALESCLLSYAMRRPTVRD